MSLACHRKIIFTTLLCVVLLSDTLIGQVYRFKNFGVDSKIPNTFIYTLDQSNNGYLWVGTASGISKFDGFDFFNVPYPDSAIGRYPKTSLKATNETMWFGCNDGTVFYTSENSLIQLIFNNSKSISDLVEGPDGFIYIIPQSGAIYKVNQADLKQITTYNIDPGLVVISGCLTAQGKFLLGTDQNLLVCSMANDTLLTLDIIDGFDYTQIMSVNQIEGKESFVIGTDGNGLFKFSITSSGSVLTRFTEHPELESLRVQSVSEDTEGFLWISTFENGMYQIKLDEESDEIEFIQKFDRNSGLAGNDIKTVFQDIEGNLWIGLFGDGLSLLSTYAFSYFEPGNTPETNNIIRVARVNNDYFLGTPSGFYLFDPETYKTDRFINLQTKTGNKGIASYHIDSEGNIWVGSMGSGLFIADVNGIVSRVFSSGESGRDYIMDVVTDEKNIWLATLNGVIIIDKKSRRLKQTYNIDNGLPHNSIKQILLNERGEAYIATESDRLYKIVPDSGIVAGEAQMTGNYLNKVMSFSQSINGTIWTATEGNGAFGYSDDSVTSVDRTKGLMSNYCYSILVDSRNQVWMGHERGFSRYDPSSGTMKVFGVDFAHSGACNPQGMFESDDGKIFIGTTEGLIIYERDKDKKQKIAPFTNINYVSINDVIYPYKPKYSLPYRKRYAIKVGYVGIYFSDPEKVYYSTLLENYDNDWTKLSLAREIPYSIGDGKFKYSVISVNEDGLSQDQPASFEISIQTPVWRTWWGILLTFIIGIGVIALIISERDKSQKKIQAYLEKELDARTSVVMKQKGEIEIQNIEITDSINYAKRIQTSILPDINKLKETFKDAFILFHPRDIVSGDFYWFDKLDNDIFVLVCADSTGHGVPGAFMSMIGSTLLQDIVTRQRISKPSEILTLLDKQIFATLNQNIELGVSNDGMDIVVCEFNTKTNYVRFSSAMRPVIIVMDGEPYYIKGNRSSVGGESVIEKYYDDQEYYLNKGDIIYMFSDGLPDQFGGQDGKKMKIARLKKLIETIVNLPMDDQKDLILDFYHKWKGNLEQVDDILIMGVRV